MLRLFSRFMATGFFSGYLPWAPGTFGSLLAVVLVLLFPWLTTWWSILLVFVIGILVSSYEEVQTKIEDEPAIVIDEILGIMITFMVVPTNWIWILVGFLLFRFFDILKPFPIKQIQNLPSGWGVMLDDILAGIFAQIIIMIIRLI